MVQKSNRENIMITGGECVGCRSCEQVCPTGCIVFKPDEEGFLYPKVEEEQCIRCGKCLRHCPVLFRREEERQPEMYGVRNKNAEHCSRSASAGVADMAAREMIAAEGSVFIQMNGKQNIERLKRRKICGRSSLPNMYSLISDDAMRLQKQG